MNGDDFLDFMMSGGDEPDVFCRYSKKMRFAWINRGGCPEDGDMEMDICEGCWTDIEARRKNK